MERHFDEELKSLKSRLLEMAQIGQEMIGLSIRCLAERNAALSEEVFKLEERVNHMEVEIENEILRLLALRQPAAGDLRLLTAILKINNDLERVADQAVNIVERALDLLKQPLLKPLIDIPEMARLAQRMIQNSLDAFIRQDAELANHVCRDDDEVDRLNDRIFDELLGFMTKDPKTVARAVDLILVSRNLERIADHATNICEDVIFIVEGKNIKHHFLDEPQKEAS